MDDHSEEKIGHIGNLQYQLENQVSFQVEDAKLLAPALALALTPLSIFICQLGMGRGVIIRRGQTLTAFRSIIFVLLVDDIGYHWLFQDHRVLAGVVTVMERRLWSLTAFSLLSGIARASLKRQQGVDRLSVIFITRLPC